MEQMAYVSKLDHLKYSIESVFCNLEHVTEIFYFSSAVDIAHKKTLEE